jgi:hypothetical protein
MLSKFAIDYSAMRQHGSRVFTHSTDDPVEAEEFLMQLLLTHSRILEIRHEGQALQSSQFDRMLRIAAERNAALSLRDALGIDPLAVKDRFGFAV